MIFRVTLFLSLTSLLGASAKDWYVRQGATGDANGTNWVHAWTDVTTINWDIVHPGDNIWIAGGSYGAMKIQTTGATNQPLYIARVRTTNSIPTQTAGWSPDFDSTVIIDTINCNSEGFGNFMTIDGQVPFGGIVVTNTSTGCRDGTNFFDTYTVSFNGSGASDVTLLNLDISGRGSDTQKFGCGPDYDAAAEGRCISHNSPSLARNFRVAYCQIHNMGTLILTGHHVDMIIEHNRLFSNLVGNPTVNHPNVWVALGCTNVNFQFNVISNWQAEGIMFTPVSVSDPPNVNWFIHGNLWVDAIPYSAARILETQYTTNGPIYFCNNTCVNAGIGISTNGLLNYGHWSADCAASNNIFIKTGDPINTGFQTGRDDYNLSDLNLVEPHGISGASTNIFVNPAARDYRIIRQIGQSHPRDKGVTLRPEFRMDIEGHLRGADGAWDIGAYEFQNRLEILPLSFNPSGATLTWQSVTGLVYFVQQSSNPAGQAFFTIASNIVGQPIVTSYTDSRSPGKGAIFYRVGVQNRMVHYVAQNSTNSVAPYLSWETAATNIQDAVDAGYSFSRILVSNGVYQAGGRTIHGNLTNRLAVHKPVTVQSVNGPGVTVIQGAQIAGTTNGDAAVRCVYLTNDAALIGFTLTKGATRSAGDAIQEQSGGAVWCESTNVVLSNCVISVNSAAYSGGGVYQGTLFNSQLLSNSITGAGSSGGGACLSDLNNCILMENSAGSGAGAFGGSLKNCTAVRNFASSLGGGVLNSTVKNSIVFRNFAPAEPNYSNSTFEYSCTFPLPPGAGNTAFPPQFVYLADGNLRLQAGSTCINSGANAYAPPGPDLDGNPRIVGGTVDMGAYEFQTPASIIASSWLLHYGLATDGSADFTDSDNDGMNNWQEWLAGTDPTNGSSALRLLAPMVNASNITVPWQSATGVVYFVERSDSVNASFSLIGSNITGQIGTTSYTDTNATGAGPWYYRVGVQQP